MLKRALGNLKNIGEHATRNTKKTRLNQAQAKENAAESHGISVLFLLKFHCELNFIEQCWGHAKRVYRQMPPSSMEEDLARNLVDALESVTVEQMQNLTGKQAAWASKKYRGHRVLPYSILAELEKTGL
ncbi:hypothetical protein EDB19DRAFT_1659622 [Suillus lakei]|nr:hypothetical protein EDB19DRAFT_1659622 [Suillus lakei]